MKYNWCFILGPSLISLSSYVRHPKQIRDYTLEKSNKIMTLSHSNGNFLILCCNMTLNSALFSLLFWVSLLLFNGPDCFSWSHYSFSFFKIFFLCGPFVKSLLNLLQYYFFFYVLDFGHETLEILAPWPGIEPTSPAWGGDVLAMGNPSDCNILTTFLREQLTQRLYPPLL